MLFRSVELSALLDLPVREQIGRSKYIEEQHIDRFEEIQRNIKKEINALVSTGETNV